MADTKRGKTSNFQSEVCCIVKQALPPLMHRQLLLHRNLQTSKAPLKSQAQGTSLFTSAASNQVFSNSPWEAQVRLPEGERMRQIRGVFQRIVRGKLRSGCQKVREGRLGVKAGVV